MEEIILKLLSNDNVSIQQATLQLKDAFKNSENTTTLLYQLMSSSHNTEVRQYAAILLRKRYNKGKHWMQLLENTRNQFKAVLIQALVQETEKSVRNAITQLIGIVLKHEIPHNRWPEMLQLIQDLLSNNDLNNQKMGMYTLSTITEIAPEVYLPHCQTIMNLLNNALTSSSDSTHQLTSYVLQTMTHLVTLAEGNQEMTNAYHQMIPITVHVIQSLAISSPETAKLGMDLLVELCETAVNVISPHVKILIGMCLTICNNQSMDDEIKTKSVMFIGCLIKIKKKAIIKHKLVEPIVDMLYSQMSLKTDEENEDVYFTGENGNTPITSATQTLDLLALHVPPEKLVPHLLIHIEPSIRGTDVYAKKAAYLALAVLAEGCSEYIKTKYLEILLKCICQGITDNTLLVRNAAFFALGQFSEHLQPDISKFASDLLPVLFQYLTDVCTQIKQENTELPSVDRMFYALEILAENLNEALLPYLPTLMSILFEILNANSPVHVSELALSAIGAAANASKEEMLPYLESIILILNRYLTEKQTDETLCLQIQAVDTLGVIARTIGEKSFAPLAIKSLQIGLMLLKGTSDPDLKKSLYGLFASVSMVVKKDMSSVLPEIFDSLITSIQSTEGINAHYKNDENPDFLVYEGNSDNEEEDIENTDNEDDDDDDFIGCSVDNAYVEEKEEAILALSEIAEHSEEIFLPYLERSFEEVFKVISYPQEDIRKAAIDALTRFCISFFRIQSVEGKQSAQKALSVFVPKLSELVRLDDERSVVMEALDSFSNLLKEMKLDLLFNGHEEAVMNCIMDVMLGRTECQDHDEEFDEGEAEHDELLFEYAGEVLIEFGKAVSPESFSFWTQKIFPIFLKKLKNNNNSDSQRSYSIGTMLECFPVLQHKIAPFVPELLPIFIKLTNDSCDEVRSNAIFGIGELVFYGKELVYSHYSEILQVLSNLIAKETHAGARDNVIGAIARLIITNHTIVPLEQVFPVFVNHLPLKEDLEENKTVFKCILVLYQNGHAILHSHMKQLLKVAVEILPNNVDQETKSLIVEFLKQSQRDFSNDWNLFCSELPVDVKNELQKL